MKFSYRTFFLIVLLFQNVLAFAASGLVVYSSKNASYIKPLFDDYSRETGVVVSYMTAPTATLMARLTVEGNVSKADFIFATGASYFHHGATNGLFATVQSSTLEKNVPGHLQSDDNKWFSISKRARTIIYHSDKIKKNDLIGYADLALPKWKGKLCLRTAKAEYTQSLVAIMIQRLGEEKVAEMLNGWVNNLAISPLADDSQIMDAIEKGQCDVGIVNSYYYARLKRKKPDTRLKLFWADQDTVGVHMNVTAAAVTANAPNKSQAIDLLEWLTTKRVQARYARLSMEYPVNEKVYPAREVAKWGRFKEDQTLLDFAGKHNKTAVKLMKQTGYN